MKLNTKIVGILILAFLLLSLLMACSSLLLLSRNQTDIINTYRNELSQTSLELLDANAALFFKFIDTEMKNGNIATLEDITNIANEIDPSNNSIVLVDLHTKELIGDKKGTSIKLLYVDKAIDQAINNWVLNEKKEFEFSNFREFIDGNIALIPTKMYFNIYEKMGLVIVYGKSFYSGQIRLQYLVDQNNKVYMASLVATVLMLILSLIAISCTSISLMKTLVVEPIQLIANGFKQIVKGNLDIELAISSADEIGELSESFNETVKVLKKSRKELGQLMQSRKLEALGQLASGVAHDFNNMLFAILVNAELLKSSLVNDQDSLNNIDTIIMAASRSAELTRKLLDFGRGGNTKVKYEYFDIHPALDDASSLLSGTIGRKITIRIDKGATGSTIPGNYSQLVNAFINMGINSSHAMPDGGEIDFITRDAVFNREECEQSPFDLMPGEYIEIEIRDNGVGIPENDLPMIFEPFYTTKEQGQGTGLGLASVYVTVLEHRGAITVESKVNSGTSFHIYLPRKTDQNENKFDLVDGDVTCSGTILLVDDEYVIRKIVKDMLVDLGYNVIVSENGAEALEIFKNRGALIDLIILDMKLPVMDGHKTFDLLREINPDVKVILSSGFAEEEELSQMFSNGLTAFIQKPIEKVDLARKVCAAMKK